MISDVRNSVPTGKVFAEIFCKILCIRVMELLSVQLSEEGHSSVGKQESVDHDYKFEQEIYL